MLFSSAYATESASGLATTSEVAKTEIVDPALAAADQQVPAPGANMPGDPAITEECLEAPKDEALGILFDVNVGTQGVGFAVGYEFNKYFKTRLRAAFLGYDHDDTWSDVDVQMDFSGNNTGIMFDYHPFGGTFRLTAGLTISELAIKATGKLNNDGINYDGFYGDFGGYDFQVDGSTTARIKGEYEWNRVQPYLGIGWSSDGEGDSSFYFTCDIGINFIGSADLETSYSGATVQYKPTGSAPSNYKPLDTNILNDAIMEEGKDFFDIADKIWFYPVIQLGVGYRF